MQDARASGTPYCDQSHRMKATIAALKAAGKLKGRPKGAARLRAANVTNAGMCDRVLRCPTCREFLRFDADGFGRATEACRCGVRWAVATGAA
jgi:hypothetical protein